MGGRGERRGRWVLIRVHVNVPAELAGPPPPVEAAVRLTLSEEGVDEGEISVTLVADREIAELHERYLGVAGATDVLSFALHGEDEPVLGDIYIGYETAARSARDLGLPRSEELVRLTVHGVLHILGHDHPVSSREASPMYRRQEALVRRVVERESVG